ncbi:unnamed protein product [Phytophthora fragariaefolia]|uniref:Unnamed protein product n=1 Tax=Phytophthora fragariaefolia TaxID=1490495 RepID=A0A9W6YHD3_9STRA|nr:unnamed protein product [Phytophthora fragariaefolia]
MVSMDFVIPLPIQGDAELQTPSKWPTRAVGQDDDPKAQRVEAYNARLSGKEKRYLPESTQLTRERSTDNEDADSEDEPAEPQRSLFRAGDQVWLFMSELGQG